MLLSQFSLQLFALNQHDGRASHMVCCQAVLGHAQGGHTFAWAYADVRRGVILSPGVASRVEPLCLQLLERVIERLAEGLLRNCIHPFVQIDGTHDAYVVGFFSFCLLACFYA